MSETLCIMIGPVRGRLQDVPGHPQELAAGRDGEVLMLGQRAFGLRKGGILAALTTASACV
jgi:hypothetical protein